MKEISNSTLALLVVVAIIVSVFGTLMSLNKLNDFSGAGGITGMFASSQTAAANLSVAESVSILIISFNGADENISLIQLGTIDVNSTNTSDVVNDWWKIENDGSVNISIEITSAAFGQGSTYQGAYSSYVNNSGYGPFSSQSTDLLGGCLKSGVVNTSTAHTCFMVKCNSTQSGTACNNTYYPLSNNTQNNNPKLLWDLSPVDTIDTAVFGVNVTVPPGEFAGIKTQYVQIYAQSSES